MLLSTNSQFINEMARSRFTRYNDREVSSGPAYKKQRVYTQKKTYMKKPGKMDLYKIVKNVLSRNVETEIASYNNTNIDFNSAIATAGDVNRILPTIAQGSDDGNRKGSQICAKTLNVKGHLMLNIFDTTNSLSGSFTPNSRICARMMVVTPKRFPNYTQATGNATTWLPNLLRKGATTQGFTGAVEDLYLPLNLDEVTVHWDQVFDLIAPFQANTGALTGVTYSISPDKSYAFFNLNIRCKDKKISFLDGSSEATNFSPIILFGYAKMDNSTADTVTTRLTVGYVSTLKYTDA